MLVHAITFFHDVGLGCFCLRVFRIWTDWDGIAFDLLVLPYVQILCLYTNNEDIFNIGSDTYRFAYLE